MAGNSFGKLFVVTTFGESHGRALGCVVDGCPPGLELDESDIQGDLDRRRPGRSRHTTQRNEPDQVQILSGTFEGLTTGTPIGLLIENKDQRSKDYGDIKDKFRPGHADYTYQQKYGLRLPGTTIDQSVGNAHKHECLCALATFRLADADAEFPLEDH